MSGRRVCFGPFSEYWLMASHSLPPGSAQSIRRTKSPRGLALHLVSHRHPAHQQLVEMPVGRQQRRGAQIHHLAHRIGSGGGGNARVQAIHRRPQPLLQQHLLRSWPRSGASPSGARSGAVKVGIAHLPQPEQHFQFELVFGHGD